MRVISGKFRGRKLEAVKTCSVRPTTDRIKEAVFSIIQFDLYGSSFLDLFAGSGQMGIEAISRGAKEATFVDFSRESVKVINKNLVSLKIKDEADVINSDSISFLRTTKKKFDIVYLDPPYDSNALLVALDLVYNVMNKNGIIICENKTCKELPDSINFFLLKKIYKYGNIMVTVYKTN